MRAALASSTTIIVVVVAGSFLLRTAAAAAVQHHQCHKVVSELEGAHVLCESCRFCPTLAPPACLSADVADWPIMPKSGLFMLEILGCLMQQQILHVAACLCCTHNLAFKIFNFFVLALPLKCLSPLHKCRITQDILVQVLLVQLKSCSSSLTVVCGGKLSGVLIHQGIILALWGCICNLRLFVFQTATGQE